MMNAKERGRRESAGLIARLRRVLELYKYGAMGLLACNLGAPSIILFWCVAVCPPLEEKLGRMMVVVLLS